MKDLSCLSPARLAAVATFAGLLCAATPALAAQVVTLASAQGFAVVGNAAVTATAGTSTITGDVGVMLSTLTGTPVVNGTIYENGVPEATAAHADFSTAFFAAAGATCPSPNNLTGFDLGVLPTLVPGVYCFSSSAGLTGTLVLDGQNVPDGEFIFQIASSFTTASNSSVIVINPGANLQVIWQVGSSATLGTGTNFIGNILADASVTLTTDASVSGRAFARTAAVTMDNNTVSCGTCDGANEVPGITPPAGALKVTGGGQIHVPSPNVALASATGTGQANFGFNAKVSATGVVKGNFNYVNKVTGLHVKGKIDDLVVIATNLDGTPKTIRFAGTCAKLPACVFAVTAEDNGHGGTTDEFGITLIDGMSAARTQRILSKGNIQLH